MIAGTVARMSLCVNEKKTNLKIIDGKKETLEQLEHFQEWSSLDSMVWIMVM